MSRLLGHAMLQALACRLLEAAGAPADLAGRVAHALVDSNLKGVDSHGVARLPLYLQQIAAGEVDPAARPHLARDDAALAVVDGNGGFGICALEEAARLAAERAKAHHVAAVGLIHAAHTGRIGQFAEMIAREGLFALILGGGAHQGWSTVVPHGGIRPVMSTNPYAFALPGLADGPVVVDFATSAVARGKVAVYAAKGEAVPEGWILDTEGRPTTDPQALFAGGMQLPAAGHKGYGMGLVAELLCCAMLPPPAPTGPGLPADLNWLVLGLDIAAFRDPADYRRDCEAYLQLVKETPPAPGVEAVLLPGEPERASEAQRRRAGIPIPDATWKAIDAAAAKLGVELEAP